MEAKWFAIMVAVVAMSVSAAATIISVAASQCTSSYANSEKTAEEIKRMCQ